MRRRSFLQAILSWPFARQMPALLPPAVAAVVAPVAEVANSDRLLYKGGALKLAVLVKGFELSDTDWIRARGDNPVRGLP